MIYDMTFKSDSEEINILWDYDNITRGAARLMDFYPKKQQVFHKNYIQTERLMRLSFC